MFIFVVKARRTDEFAVEQNLSVARKEVEERDFKLRLEKERTQVLSEKLEEATSIATGFESMTTQNGEILTKIEDQEAEAIQRDQQRDDQIREG